MVVAFRAPYTVAPYSQNYVENVDRRRSYRDNQQPCCICGYPVKPGAEHWATVSFATNDWCPDDDPESQGAFPVGPSCHRRYRVKEVA